MFLFLMAPRPTSSFCERCLNIFFKRSTSSSIAISRSDNFHTEDHLTATTDNAVSGSPKEHVFQGHKTEVGRRRRKREDKATNNARVRNSYLKLTLDESVFQSLHQMVRRAKRQWDNDMTALTRSASVSADEEQKKVSKKQAKRQLTIKPRSLPSLHMTYFFCGKVLEEMSCDELSLWNSMVRDRLLTYNNDASSSSLGEYSLRFKGITLFPPNRNYLIVGVFESSPRLDGLYKEICNLSMMEKPMQDNVKNVVLDEDVRSPEYMFPLLHGLTKTQHSRRNQNNSQSWVAHVTLGNLDGGNGADVKSLTSWLKDYKYQEGDTLQLENDIKVNGLALGGPIPSHVNVNWDFPFHPIE